MEHTPIDTTKPSFLEVHILDGLTKAEDSDPDLELTEQFIFVSIWMAPFEHQVQKAWQK
jgi:hypothetical protein